MTSKSKHDEKVHVAIRCRPMNDHEKANKVKSAVVTVPKEREVQVTCNNNLGKTYKFDKVFGPSSKQVDVYKSVVEPHIDEVLAGYNCTVLAYGQTGTGKTYTMEGERSGDGFTWETDPKAGIIPRTLSRLFDCLEKQATEFSIHVSLLEIYNEVIYDLLSPTEQPARRRIYDDGNRKGSVIIADQTEVRVLDRSEVYDILEQGATKRRTDATLMNEFSSRSHSVFTITVHSKELTKNGFLEEELVKIGKLNLVDLAGSENIGRSGAVDQRAREAGNINQSLLTLGRCITALVDHAPHIPYRESRLTRILQDSLGGATKTSIIATISPGLDNLEETLSTLDYASRAKNIQNRPKVNQKMTKRTLIKQYDNEIENLRRELMATREKNGVYMEKKQYDAMHERLEDLEATLLQRQDELENYKSLFTNITEELRIKSDEYTILQQQFHETHAQLVDHSYLEEVKGLHGQKAVTDGQEVVAVTEEVTYNIHKVHDKEERWKTADEKNRIAAEKHRKVIGEDATGLGDKTKKMVHLSKLSTETCVKTLNALSKRNEKEWHEMRAMLGEFEKTLGKNIADCVSAGTEMMSTAAELKADRDEVLSLKKEMMENSLRKVERDCSSLQKAISDKIQNLSKMTANLNSFIRDHSQKQQELFTQHTEKMMHHSDLVIQNIEALRKEQEQHLDGTFDAILEAIKTQKNKAKVEQAALHDSRVTTIVQSATFVRDNTQDVMTEISASIGNLQKESDDRVSEAEDTLRRVDASVQSLAKDYVEHSQTSAALLQESLTEVESSDKAAHENMSATEKWILDIAEDSTQLTSSLCTNMAKLETDIGETFREDLKTVTDNLLKVDQTEEKIAETVSTSVENIVRKTDQFCDHELVHLMPTGETPARKEYTYPKIFEHLPSDDALLKSFHEKMAEEAEAEREAEEKRSEEDDAESTDTAQSRDSAIGETSTESDEVDENESVSCGGGMPFFMAGKAQNDPKHSSRMKTRSRLPLRAANNVQ